MLMVSLCACYLRLQVHFFFLSPLHAFGTDVSVLRFSDYMDAGKWEVAKAVSSNYLVLG